MTAGTSETATIVAKLYQAWRAGDLATITPLLANDISFEMFLPSDVFPLAGKVVGRDEVLKCFGSITGEFEILSYEPGPILADGGMAAARPTIRYRHKKTGQTIQTRLGHFWTVRAGQITELAEYHDVAHVAAFMQTLAPA